MWLNCRIVAAIVWWKSRRHAWHAHRRSDSFGGLIMHAGVFAENKEHLYLIEYVPHDDARKYRLTDHGASMCLFDGEYHLHRYCKDRVVKGNSFEDVAKKMGKPDSPCIGRCTTLFDNVCQGCGRTVDEVARWVTMSPAEKQVVWNRINNEGANDGNEESSKDNSCRHSGGL